jgi:hypothetical protein
MTEPSPPPRMPASRPMSAEKMIKVLGAGKAGTDWTANSSAHDDLMARVVQICLARRQRGIQP